MNPLNLATKYADQLMGAKTLMELASISAAIKDDIPNLIGMEDWLRTIWSSANQALRAKDIPDEEYYNAQGLAALKRGEIIHDTSR